MKLYKYGMKLRGFSIGCQPKQGFVERQDDNTGEYYDIIVYDRKLTDEEITKFELVDLNEQEDEMGNEVEFVEIEIDGEDEKTAKAMVAGEEIENITGEENEKNEDEEKV